MGTEKRKKKKKDGEERSDRLRKMKIMLLLVLIVALIDGCHSKPQCGLRWRGPCRRTYNRALKQAKKEAYDAFDVDKDITRLETNDIKDDLATNLEAELLDIIKKSKDQKRLSDY